MKRLLLPLTLLFLATVLTTSASAARKPNIIFIMADDLGYGEVGCYGQKIIKTPNIDQLAKQGMRLTQFYSGSPVCASARCVLLTGMHPGHAFIRTNREIKSGGQLPIPDSAVTIGELLQKKGYVTAAIGKWGLGMFGSSGDPNRQGFDLFYGYNCQRHAHNHYPRFLWKNNKQELLKGNTRGATGKIHSQERFASEALSFIRENKDRPFFLYLPFAIPHLSIQVPESSLAQYKGKIPEADYKHKGYIQHPFPRAGYAAMISHMDRDIGKIMALLKQLKLDDDTIVFFTSDNGPTFQRLGGADSDFFHSAGPLKGRKGSVWEGGIRVPMIARWPGHIKPNTSSDHISAFWDVLPTLCDIAGCDTNGAAPKNIDGISITPTLFGTGKQQPRHDYLYWEFPSYGGQQAVRFGDWKAVRRGISKNPTAPIQLFHLGRDISEASDLAIKHPELVKRAYGYMRVAHVDSKEFPFRQLKEKPRNVK